MVSYILTMKGLWGHAITKCSSPYTMLRIFVDDIDDGEVFIVTMVVMMIAIAVAFM